MVATRQSELVSFDADAAASSAREIAGDDLLVATEFTPERFRVLYLSDRLVDAWGNVDDVVEVGEAVHTYRDDDYARRQHVEDIYPSVSESFGFVTYTDRMIIVRIVSGREGMYFTLVRGAETTPLVEAVKAILEG